MRFDQPLIAATLIKRYKRFLADVRLDNGDELTVHCPNSGSMRGCSTPGSRVYLSTSVNPKRKYAQTLEMIQEQGVMIGVNTTRTNHLVAEAIRDGQIAELQGIESIRPEVTTAPGHRLDFLLQRQEKSIYVEVKNCSLAEGQTALFPDAITKRGTKHLLELARLAKEGHQAVIFFCIQRSDTSIFQPAAHIDPVYAETLTNVCKQGVEILAYEAVVNTQEIRIVRGLPCQLDSREP